MPVYEFVCEECGARFEKLVSQRDQPVSCIQCAGKRVKKQFSVFATGGADAGRESVPSPCNSCGAPEQGMCRFGRE
ncbi:MAG: zinc ribbon domain-containing protein [Nitrospirae bacterium]|nr:zinc ribbon domain-containing protein [Nitrospirota bacterium]